MSYCSYWAITIEITLRNYLPYRRELLDYFVKLPWWCSSTKSSFRELKLLILDNINSYQILLFMFCFHHNLLPNAISHVISFGIYMNSQIHSHNTRASHRYRRQFARVKIKQFSILCSEPIMWNKLPHGMKNLNSLGSLKYSIKLFINI